MKNNHKIIFVSTLSIFAITSGILLSTAIHQDVKKAHASYDTASLPTTIDLNDSSESTIRNYYSSLNSLATSQRSGNNLLKNLKTILKNGQRYFNYDSGTTVWQIYEITDRDWNLSPASSTIYGTYNSSTNTITNYQYGTSASNTKNNPYIHAFYINRNITTESKAWGNHEQDMWGLNREHLWPKAEGFDTQSAAGARGDPMHLVASNGYANKMHSNLFYGYVDKTRTYTDCGDTYSSIYNNLTGYSKSLGGSTKVFEPQDCDKGDIARAMFYMAARYNYLSGSDSDGISSDNPNLELVNNLSSWSSSGYTSSTTNTGKLGILQDLLEWNRIDPPDEYEIHRNNLLYNNFTNNRNPFIDFPEWAEYIWGTSYNGSYDSSVTGYAKPSDDTINDWNSSSTPIPVTGVSISPTSLTMLVGENQTLNVTISPNYATNQNVSFTSSNNNVATVSSSGVVTARMIGDATITVTTEEGHYTASASITVNNTPSIGNNAYQLVTGANPLSAGDEVIIAAQANQNATSCFVLSNQIYKTYYLTALSGTSNNQLLDVTGDMTIWTVGGTSGNYTFHSDTGYLYGAKNGTYYNLYATGDNSTDNAWNIVSNSASTGYDIYNSSGVYLEYYSYYNEFTGYSRSATDFVINFYKKVTSAEDFASIFLSSVSCDPTGQEAPTLSKTWNELSSIYGDIFSTQEQNILKNATYTVSSSVTGTYGTSNNIALAMSKYDIIVAKYSYNDFISRKNTPAFGYVNSAIKDMSYLKSSNIPMLIIISSIIAMSGFGLYILIRKKKEQ